MNELNSPESAAAFSGKELNDKTPSGFFYIDKPEDCSSFDVIRQLRKTTSQKKFGHTGTLDPFASGLLVLCLNKATKMSSLIINSDKEYLVKMSLGVKTDTGDRDGKSVEQRQIPVLTASLLEEAVVQVCSLKEQIPPAFSAKKIQGKAAYHYARQGKEVELPSKDITIHEFKIISYDSDSIIYRTRVSKGTYVRTLSETFAAFLGTAAHTTDLRRLSVGNLSVNKAVKPEQISPQNWQEYLIPITSYAWDFPVLHLKRSEAAVFINGSSLALRDLAGHEAQLAWKGEANTVNISKVIVYTAGQDNEKICLGIAAIRDGLLCPQRVL